MNNIFQLLILGLAGGLIFMDLFIKINLDDTVFSKNSKIQFILLLSILVIVSYKYSGYYKILVNYALLIVLNYLCFKRTILTSIIISTIVYVVYMLGDIIAGITLMNLPNVNVAVIQNNSYFSLLVWICVNIVDTRSLTFLIPLRQLHEQPVESYNL